MIAQLMAQRALIQNPGVDCADMFRRAVRLCAKPKATAAEIASMQAALAGLHLPKPDQADVNSPAEIADLCQRALSIRRAALAKVEPQVSYRLEARGRLVA